VLLKFGIALLILNNTLGPCMLGCGTHGPKLQCKTSWALGRITCNTQLPQQKEARTGELNSALTQKLVDLKRRATRKAAKRAAKEAEQRETRKAIK